MDELHLAAWLHGARPGSRVEPAAAKTPSRARAWAQARGYLSRGGVVQPIAAGAGELLVDALCHQFGLNPRTYYRYSPHRERALTEAYRDVTDYAVRTVTGAIQAAVLSLLVPGIRLSFGPLEPDTRDAGEQEVFEALSSYLASLL